MAKDDDQKQINFKINPDNAPVYHVDSFLFTHNDQTLVMNFAQALPDPSQQQIISRVSLTREQAREFLRTFTEHMQKFEV